MGLPKILIATKDKDFYATAKGALAESFDLTGTSSGEKGLKILAKDPRYTVIVSSLKLSGMNGREFLAKAKEKHPRLIRIMVSGKLDFEQTVEIVNTAGISYILDKRCASEELTKAIHDSVLQYRRDKAESEAMKETLIGCVKILVDIMDLNHPEAVSRSKRILHPAQKINKELKAMSPQFMDMVVLLSHIGCMGLPPQLLKNMEKGTNISKEDVKTFRTHPEIAVRLLENIPRMGKMAEIVRHQNTPFSQKPPLGARILKVCIDIDQIKTRKGNPEKALGLMRERAETYDPDVVEALARQLNGYEETTSATVTLAELKPGMIMQQDMVSGDGAILLNAGETLSEISHLRLQTFNDLLQVKEPIHATVPDNTEEKATTPEA